MRFQNKTGNSAERRDFAESLRSQVSSLRLSSFLHISFGSLDVLQDLLRNQEQDLHQSRWERSENIVFIPLLQLVTRGRSEVTKQALPLFNPRKEEFFQPLLFLSSFVQQLRFFLLCSVLDCIDDL